MIFCCYPKDNINESKDGSIAESMLSVMIGTIIYDVIRSAIDDAEESS